MSTTASIERFASTLAALDAEVNWDRVAQPYCDGDAEGFFDEERRGAVLDAGLRFASDVEEALGANTSGASLYVGAGVAELAPMLFESIVLGRGVAWVTLASEETAELERALAIVGGKLPRPRTAPLRGVAFAPRNHIWMTSVLTDPDAFPALHDRLYGRQGTAEAIGGGHPKRERAAARNLVLHALDACANSTLLTTTDEELEIWGPLVQEARGRLEVPRTGRTSGIVGDVVRMCRLTLPNRTTR